MARRRDATRLKVTISAGAVLGLVV